jgi:DNA-directed RNA polymerase subunit RPC12/RpoP
MKETSDYQPKYLKTVHPKEYGFICGHCSKRYGDKQETGWIDVMRCDDCKQKRDYN